MKIEIKPLNLWERLADFLMTLVMHIIHIISGAFGEKPQQTHKWNNRKLLPSETKELDLALMATVNGAPCKIKKQGGIWFHLPFAGGWKHYVVIAPTTPQTEWYVGWHNEEVSGVSRIRLSTPVRLLRGPREISFFGISAEGEQIEVEEIGRGTIGDKSSFGQLYPLL